MATTTAVFLAKIMSDASQAVSEFRKVDGQVDRTTTSSIKKFDQFSTLAKGAMVGLAAGAGTALVAFGAQAVAQFQEVALGAGKLRDSLGLTAEEASRLQEVGADLGVSTSALEANLGRMNRTAASSPEKFDAIGAAIARNEDGTTNVNETFLNTIDALNKIPDASKRAQKAQEIFGRSWMDVAELVGLGADGVREAMASVEDAKVIDDAEIEKARKFRDAMDGLKGVVESLSIELGGSLVPALSEAAETLTRFSQIASTLKLPKIAEWATKLGPLGVANKLIDVYEGIGGVVGGLFTEEKKVADYASTFTQAQEMISDSISAGALEFSLAQAAVRDYGDAMGGVAAGVEFIGVVEAAAGFLDGVARAAGTAARNADALERKWSSLTDSLSDRSAFLDIEDGWDDVQTAAEDAYIAAVNGSDDAEAAGRDHERAIIAQKERVIEYGDQVLGLPPEALTNVLALIDDGKLAEAEWELAMLARPRYAEIRLRVTGQTSTLGGDIIGQRAFGSNVQIRHSGGTVDGPPGSEQLVLAMAGETVLPTHKPGWDGGGAMSLPTAGTNVSSTFNVTVNAGIGADGARIGNMIIETIKQYERHNGAGWRS
jgi:hypothetical protein